MSAEVWNEEIIIHSFVDKSKDGKRRFAEARISGTISAEGEIFEFNKVVRVRLHKRDISTGKTKTT